MVLLVVEVVVKVTMKKLTRKLLLLVRLLLVLEAYLSKLINELFHVRFGSLLSRSSAAECLGATLATSRQTILAQFRNCLAKYRPGFLSNQSVHCRLSDAALEMDAAEFDEHAANSSFDVFRNCK